MFTLLLGYFLRTAKQFDSFLFLLINAEFLAEIVELQQYFDRDLCH